MNEGQPGRDGLISMIGDATGLTIPVVGTTSATGENLYSTPGATVTVTVDYTTETRTAYNVLAETESGNDANTVMAGAHLDSVQDGAGINDNGTGSAALLETAIQMSKTKPNNTVRFAWWGAEEEGLLGSEYYVANLTEEQAADISLYLNFDMIGSPNYFFGVYDGDNSSGTAPVEIIPRVRLRSRTSSRASTTAVVCPIRTPTSRVAPTTDRSSRSASPPAACSPVRRASRPPMRPRSTAVCRARRTTRATTRRATTSPARARMPRSTTRSTRSTTSSAT